MIKIYFSQETEAKNSCSAKKLFKTCGYFQVLV